MVVRNVETVVGLAHNLLAHCRGPSETAHSNGGELGTHGHGLFLANLKIRAHTGIQDQPRKHGFGDPFNHALPSHPVDDCTPVHELSVRCQPARPSQQRGPDGLQAHDHFVHRLIIEAQAGEAALHVEQKAIELVIRHAESTVNLSQVSALVNLRASKSLGQVNPSSLLDGIVVLAPEEAPDAVVSNDNIKESIHDGLDPRLPVQSLE
mmetsp:Transcript_23957/g.54637  ORF Transcript_23957/g.54637 Transcript_23957/m.54637 type:complete len:208 (-) Transcript_23957:693-1316(-)